MSAAAVLGAIALSTVSTALIAIVGATLTVTSLIQKCPLNNLLGVNTYEGRKPPEIETEQEVVERPARVTDPGSRRPG